MKNWVDHVLPHGKLNQLAPNLWQLTGSLPRGPLPRNMLVYRFQPGKLLIYSAVAVSETCLQEIFHLGQPEVLVVPNAMHRLDASAYKNRFPDLQVLCPQAAMREVQRKVNVSGSCEEQLPGLGIRPYQVPGIKQSETVFEFNVESGKALVFTDLLFNLPHLPGPSGFVLRIIGSSGFFGITSIGKLLLLQNKQLFKAWLIQQADRHDIQLICVGHGEPIQSDCPKWLRTAAERL